MKKTLLLITLIFNKVLQALFFSIKEAVFIIRYKVAVVNILNDMVENRF